MRFLVSLRGALAALLCLLLVQHGAAVQAKNLGAHPKPRDRKAHV